MFITTADVGARSPKDCQKRFRSKPVFDSLFLGIVCVDISGLTRIHNLRGTRVARVANPSKSSWSKCVELRPEAIVLE